jgi:hypothetical protein
VFEPSKNGSPLGQKMREPWPKLPPGLLEKIPMFHADFPGFT